MLGIWLSPTAAQPLHKLPLSKETAASDLYSRLGLGTVVSGEGHILTSAHVVRGCRFVRYARPGERQGLASVIGTDENNDLALLKTVQKAMPAATFLTYPPAKEGETVNFVDIGSDPHGLPAHPPMARAMAVSRLGAQRDVRLFAISTRLIGERRNVQPGDSGGPVFNDDGDVVGIIAGIVPYGTKLSPMGSLRGLGYVLHAAMSVLFLRAYNVPIRVRTETQMKLASGGEPVIPEAARVTVRLWCNPT
jgi:S1-C subfamily serine protease